MEGGIFITRKKHTLVTAAGEALELNRTIHLPEADECIRLVSFGRLSSLGFLRYVAEHTVIHHLDCSTFRVGPRAIKELKRLRGMEQLTSARFVVATLMRQDGGKSAAYGYYEALLKLCAGYGWQVLPMANHSKLMLFDTDCGKFVLETSSNLNDAPNWEQFCFQRDAGLYDFYHGVFDGIFSPPESGTEIEVERGAEAPAWGSVSTWDTRKGGDLWQENGNPLSW
ncbi:MAG: hypothetical protein RR295_07950 [Oscillospiraceae bacterium]